MKKFVVKLLLLVVVIAAISMAINFLYVRNLTNFGTMGEQKNDSAYITDVPMGIDICDVGNSHGYYGFNYEGVDSGLTCFNFALPSQSMSYNYRVIRNYKDNLSENATVFICVSYNSFFGKSETELDDFASKNKRYYHFLNKENIKQFDLANLVWVKYLPALAASPDKLIITILGRNEASDVWANMTDADAAKEHGLLRYNTHVAAHVGEDGKRIANEDEIQACLDLINMVKEIGGTPILVTTPFLKEYPESVAQNDPAFYDDFYGVINDIVDKTGVTFIDSKDDERFNDKYEYFFNTDHMNRDGAYAFTNALIGEIVK